MDRPSPPATNEYFPTTTHVVRRTRVERIFEGEEGGIEHVFVDALDFFFFLNPPNAIPSTNLSLSRIYIYFSILYRSVQIIICIFGINRIITSSLFDSSLPRLKIRLGRRKRGGEESFKFRLPIVDKKIHVGRDVGS